MINIQVVKNGFIIRIEDWIDKSFNGKYVFSDYKDVIGFINSIVYPSFDENEITNI